MPAKRSRSKSTVRSSSKKSKTTDIKRTWPYASKGTGPLFDPFPAKITARLRYSQVLTLDPALGTPAGHLFRCNSIFDPDYSGIGHQPYGHDVYQMIYNHYKVNSSAITMTPCSSSSNANGMFGVTLTDDPTVSNDYDTIREIKTTKMSTMIPSNGTTSVTNYYNRKQVFNPGNDYIGASFGSNPIESQMFHCWSEGSNATDDPAAVDYLITITYDVEMWELKDMGQS